MRYVASDCIKSNAEVLHRPGEFPFHPEDGRKSSLFPESLLEPELWDERSAFLKQTISELLQDDLAENRADTAKQRRLQRNENAPRR
ncbi:hypothetical protein OKW29_000571 [Paraburkholderia sp. CI3]